MNNLSDVKEKQMFNIQYLENLPPNALPFEKFKEQFSLGATSTEQLHPITTQLSQTIHKSIPEGLGLLLDVDEKVIEGFESFIPAIELQAPLLTEKLKKGGRIFLVGSGSSGRVAVDMAAKCVSTFPEMKERVHGVIAGGDSALIRAKEGFEDSEEDGRKALEKYRLNSKDTVILISASGSASFNVGCGNFSSEKEARVLYFYNSNHIPSRTKNLFSLPKNPVTPLCVDIGPQAIAGSTRLQGATIALAGVGALLVSALYLLDGKESLSKEYPKELAVKMKEGVVLIRKNLKKIGIFINKEKEVFEDPQSNFREINDKRDQGYVTFLAAKDSIREVLIDSTETSPTFSTNPIRKEFEEHKKRAEFRTYLVGENGNDKAWQALLGREIDPEDAKDTNFFLLSCDAMGLNSYQKRPKGKGNLLIGVAKLKKSETFPQTIISELKSTEKQGGKVGLILLCEDKLTEEQIFDLLEIKDDVFVMENFPSDPAGFTETILLKQILNLISNGSMLLMNKIHGNQMIDVRASNHKLIDRCMRLIWQIWSELKPNVSHKDEKIYHLVLQVNALKKFYEEKGVYTPSVVKIVLAILALKKTAQDFQEIIDYLREKQETIDWIAST